ncbi:unnamed protein product [Toxocara canis]|uniref:Methyltransf_11 domain-containing protein n=1 Tax=Toxocara canis TaxID=6265 RepID=A0A183UHC4_TOXCA|nr:unnamed protein product [Toxocara canis]
MSAGDVSVSQSEHIKLSSDRVLFFISADTVEKNVHDRGFKDDIELKDTSKSDLTSSIYEGGLKVWEGSIDLCNFVDSTTDEVVFINKSVLENKSVIECFTKDNFILNNVKIDKCQFYAGDWADFKEFLGERTFDIILSAETIYNERMYERLHDLLDAALTPDGLVLLAAKLYYFGVGGSVPAFLDFVKSRGKFDSIISWTSKSEVPRQVIQLTRKASS